MSKRNTLPFLEALGFKSCPNDESKVTFHDMF